MVSLPGSGATQPVLCGTRRGQNQRVEQNKEPKAESRPRAAFRPGTGTQKAEPDLIQKTE